MSDKQPFTVHDEPSLNWAAGKAEAHRRLANQYMDMAEQAYDFWLSKANDELDQAQYFNDMISQYADEQHRLNPDWHYTESPFMRIVWTKPKTKITVSSSKDVINQFKGTKYVTEEVQHKIHWGDLKKTCRLLTMAQSSPKMAKSFVVLRPRKFLQPCRLSTRTTRAVG